MPVLGTRGNFGVVHGRSSSETLHSVPVVFNLLV